MLILILRAMSNLSKVGSQHVLTDKVNANVESTWGSILYQTNTRYGIQNEGENPKWT